MLHQVVLKTLTDLQRWFVRPTSVLSDDGGSKYFWDLGNHSTRRNISEDSQFISQSDKRDSDVIHMDWRTCAYDVLF
jgi:hypothetical protein